jgi:hypothetical protein
MFIKFSHVERQKRIYADGLKSDRHKTKVLMAHGRGSHARL